MTQTIAGGFISALIILFFLAFSVWLYGVYINNQFSVPNADLSKYKKVLVIYPHPDDEAFTTGGTIQQFKALGANVTLCILTKGEKGTDNASLSQQLKEIRTKELETSAKFLGVDTLILEDFGDGELSNKKTEVDLFLHNILSEQKPDLVITYDTSGLYGHPDHITLSEIVTNQVAQYPHTKLWYASFPKRLYEKLGLPEHMATDPSFKDKRNYPNIKVFTAPFISSKMQAIYSHKSQLPSFVKGLPVKQLPLWFYYSMPLYEFFYEV